MQTLYALGAGSFNQAAVQVTASVQGHGVFGLTQVVGSGGWLYFRHAQQADAKTSQCSRRTSTLWVWLSLLPLRHRSLFQSSPVTGTWKR